MSSNSLEWALNLRQELKAEIALMAARAGSNDRNVEVLGLASESDHLADLRHRLEQVERLIDAIEDLGPPSNAGWVPAMSAESRPGHHPKPAG